MSEPGGTHTAEACLPPGAQNGRPSGALCARWFAIRTRSRAEQAATRRLAAQEIETFFPRYLEPVQWSDRLKETWRPLFPGYVFAQVRGRDEAEIVTRTPGVVQMLTPPIPPAQIESLRIVCQSNQTLTPATYRPGDAVRIESGPFAGCEGIVDRARPNRLTLRIDLLRRAVSVEIDRRTAIRRVL